MTHDTGQQQVDLVSAGPGWHVIRDDERGLYEVQFRVFPDGTLRLVRKFADKATGRRYGDALLWLSPPSGESKELTRPGCEYGHWGDPAAAAACDARGSGHELGGHGA